MNLLFEPLPNIDVSSITLNDTSGNRTKDNDQKENFKFTLSKKISKKIGFLGRNHHLFLFYLYAATLMGYIFIPFNYRWNKTELNQAIEDVYCDVLVIDEEFFLEYMEYQQYSPRGIPCKEQ